MPTTHRPNIRYPVSQLDIGDSFFVPSINPASTQRQVERLAGALGMKVSYRTGIDTATNIYGVRIIRVS